MTELEVTERAKEIMRLGILQGSVAMANLCEPTPKLAEWIINGHGKLVCVTPGTKVELKDWR